MPGVYVVAGLVAAVVLALGLAQLVGRRRYETVAYASEREERLARRLAATLGCSPAQAVPWLRKELQIAPDQTDETILKRAAYHYRRGQPDAPCPVWRGGRSGG